MPLSVLAMLVVTLLYLFTYLLPDGYPISYPFGYPGNELLERVKVIGLDIYVPPLTGKTDQEQFTIEVAF